MKTACMIWLLMFLVVQTGCNKTPAPLSDNPSGNTGAESEEIRTPEDLARKRIAVLTGTVHDAFLAAKYPEAVLLRFDRPPDMITALKTRKVDAVMLALESAKVILKNNHDLALLSKDMLDLPLGIGFSKNNPRLRKQFNHFLATSRSDGTYDSVYHKWFTGDPETARTPSFPEPPGDRTLTVGVAVNDLPYVALIRGEYSGFDIEIIRRFAHHAGYRPEFLVMEFSSLVTALAAGKVEMIADGIAITEERLRQIDFSDPYVDFKTAVIIRNIHFHDHQTRHQGFLERLSHSFYQNILYEKRYLHILSGLWVTICLSVLSAMLGTLIGAGICMMNMSNYRALQIPARWYISLLRGTPVLVLLMVIYYVVFASMNINPLLVSVIAFGMNFGAYVSEIFRSGISAIDKGQKEAAIAAGFTRFRSFRFIILPQAIRHILPVYKGEFISMIRMTSVVGYIAVEDLTRASDIIRSRTFDAFFPLIMVAILYLVLAWIMSWLLDSAKPLR